MDMRTNPAIVTETSGDVEQKQMIKFHKMHQRRSEASAERLHLQPRAEGTVDGLLPPLPET